MVSLSEIGFSEAARGWFEDAFDAPTPVQAEGWARIAADEHALLIAPTGSGKTLAAFFYFIDRLARRDADAAPGVRVLYISPLKALVYDIERNLRAPLVGIQRTAERLGAPFRAPRVAIRTGDTPARERRLQRRDPAEILVTTPESLYLLLTSQARETLRTVKTVIVDEIHALAPTKRGAHLALSLERLAAATAVDPVRIGLSATARPLEEIARFLGGDRPVSIVDTSQRPRLDLRISVPVPDMTRPDVVPPDGAPDDVIHGAVAAGDVEAVAPAPGSAPPRPGSVIAALREADVPPPTTSLWPALHPRLLEAILAHRSAILFVNSRGLCEKLAQQLNELAGEALVRAHHGSIAHDQRLEIEEALKRGTLRAIVATSSLELGIDMGAVDLVILVESPGAVARGLQRVGRAGHHVGETSRGLLYPKHRGDLLEATVVAEGMRRGEVEPITLPRNPLDVLAQQIVAHVAEAPVVVDDLYALVRRTASYADLSREILTAVLDMLAGRYPSTDFAELRPRLVWDREHDRLEARRGAGRLAILSGGTIPDRGLYAVHMGSDGPRIGELDEEMVHETRPGETVTLGASTWRVTEITRDRVVVVPAPGEPGKLPFWRGEGPGRPVELGRAVGAFSRALGERLASPDGPAAGRAAGEAWLRESHGLDEWAARNLVDYVATQQEATGALPTDRAITVERFRDELGDWRVCILSPFGARVHAPWALAIEAALSEEAGFEVQALWSDDGIVLRFADAERTPALDQLLPEPEDVEDRVVAQLGQSSLFAAQFRENAARALLLPRRRPGARTPLWTQRLRAQNLLAVARQFPSFPIMLETYRACLQDVFDLPALRELLGAMRRREVRVDDVETRTPSPFARSLVFAYTATYLYQGDVPVAERRAQALALDRHMLRELLGEEDLRELLDADVIDSVVATLQGRTEERAARHPDGLHDLLRRLGDLTPEEIEARCQGDDARAWLDRLQAERRAVALRIAGETRWVAVEDVALFRDALGVNPPAGLPSALLETVERPFEQLVRRWARQSGPFETTTLAERYGLLPTQLEPVLAGLEKAGQLVSGGFHPLGREHEWCDPDVLKRLRRHTLAKLRDEVAPVEGPVLGRFLAEWHGLDRPGRGEASLDEALDQLEGLPLSFAELERAILPARVVDYDARMLDELGALGQWVWVGRGALGRQDGRIALFRRDRIGLLAEPPVVPEDAGPLHHRVLDLLGERGASFFVELWQASGEREQAPLFEALQDLVWWGLVTNDTFAPLRALGRRAAPPRRRGGRHAPPTASAGRWSRVQDLMATPTEPTVRAHARAGALLDRHGVVSREAMALEEWPNGWSGVYPVLRAMEESGRIRRGHFVEGFTGAQFAFVAAVDRMRAARVDPDGHRAWRLAATDPANPHGALLPWPDPRHPAARPRRSVGARVVLVDGEPVFFVDGAGRKLWTFPVREPAREAETWLHAARALGHAGPAFPRGGLRLERIDDVDARESPLAEAFARAGYRRSYKGLELERAFGRDADRGDARASER